MENTARDCNPIQTRTFETIKKKRINKTIFLFALGAFGAHGSLLVPEYQLGALYAGYNGEYAGQFKNYEKSYAYEYGVSDPHTGDHKSQWETKDKEGTVRGSYSLLEPDGTTRIVDYIADEGGFRAVVKKVGIHGTSVETHGAAPQIAVAAPVEATIIEDPVAYKSYDGGYQSYADLKPIVNDIYTRPNDYLQAPAVELVHNPPQHHEAHSGVYPHNAPEAEGLIHVALPQEYLPVEHVVPQKEYLLVEHVVPQKEYLPVEHGVPQKEYWPVQHVVPQKEYLPVGHVVPQKEYLPAEHVLPQREYVYPQPAPRLIQEYIAPQYKAVPSYQPVPLENEAYSYVQEEQFHGPKGEGIFVEAPRAVPEQVYYPASSLHGQYDLNVDYHY